MNSIYSDGSYDAVSGLGAYCIVIVPHGGQPDWYVKRAEQAHGSTAVETAGLAEAIQMAHELSLKNLRQSKVFCDSLSALQALQSLADSQGVILEYIPGHQINTGKDSLNRVNNNVKRQHWADVMAHKFVAELVLDRKHEQAHNHERN